MVNLKTIAINCVSATNGGGYSIVYQLLEKITTNQIAQKMSWYIFVSNTKFNNFQQSNIHIIKQNAKQPLRRILWDLLGINIWLKKNSIKPDIVVSLQNTGMPFTHSNQYVYIHQSIPFADDISFKDFELKLKIWKRLYLTWMKWSTPKDSTLIVQTNWIKNAVAQKMHFPLDKIYVFRPEVQAITKNTSCQKQKNNKNIHTCFYPAVPRVSYKNHELLINSLAWLKQKDRDLFNKIRIIFTANQTDNRLTEYYSQKAKTLDVVNSIVWTGYKSRKEMEELYNITDLLLFPSQLETFGLPLVEAASLGKPILVLDRPYSRDVLKNYDGATFLPDSSLEWGASIQNYFKLKKDACYKVFLEPGNWDEFLEWLLIS